MKKAVYPFFSTLLLLVSSSLLSQNLSNNSSGIADTFRANGKIFVVVVVLLIIFFGVCMYLFNIGREVSKIKKKLSQ